MATDTEREEIERWFLSRGLPHFIEDYSATRDIFARALPLLTLVFVFEMFTALNLDWHWWANVLAIAGGFGCLAGFLALSNMLRHRRLFERPHSVGIPELTLFVLAPPLVPLIFGGKGTVGIATVLFNVILVAVVYIVTSYAVIPTMLWAVVKLWDQLGALTGLLTRALPLLLLFITFLFLNPDTWQVAGHLYGIYFTSTILLFVFIGTLFVLTRLPREIGDLNHFTSADQVYAEAGDVVKRTGDLLAETPLSRRQWGNAGFVVLVSQAIQVLLVAVVVALFLIVLGLLAIRPDTVTEWVGQPHVLFTLTYGHERLELTEELVRVSVFLAAFSALYFTVVALTDATYREEFFREVVTDVRKALAVRVVYLSQINEPGRSQES